jgi:phosphonate transport system ATP-binding protein
LPRVRLLLCFAASRDSSTLTHRQGTRLLELVNLSRRFGETLAVTEVSVTVGDGEMIGIIGRSGAGKSTLLRLINRLIEPTEGRILCDGIDVTGLRGRPLRAWRARTAMIFQQFNLVNRLDVLTNVMCGRLYHMPAHRVLLKWFTPAERALAIRALDRLGLAEVAMNRADALSGGQQQRVAIARALVQQPGILLADEPIASLDPLNARLVMDALADINRRDGITVLTNLHTLDAARTYCRRIIGMAAGRIVFDGAPEALTETVLRDIYGSAGQEALDERITATSLPAAALAAWAS